MAPNYQNTQQIIDGYNKAGHLLLTAGTAMVVGGQKRTIKLLGLGALAGFALVQRSHTKYRESLHLRLPIALPLTTTLALGSLHKRRHFGSSNIGVSIAANRLSVLALDAEVPRDLLLRTPAPGENETATQIRLAHAELEEALTLNASAPLL